MAENLALHRERPDDPELIALLTEREAYLQRVYPERVATRHAVEVPADELVFYGLRRDAQLVGCGCLIRHPKFLELKKVFITEAMRKNGLGQYLIKAIETEARAFGYTLLKLEVGIRQEAALTLYRSLGYKESSPFSPYRPDPLSYFLEKLLSA